MKEVGMSYYLAIDSGGTKADFLLADKTRELGRVRTGTIKRMRTDAGTAAANLDEALSALTAQTGISMQSITRTCIGTAGETVPLVTDFLREAFASRVSGQLVLLGDVEIALDAAFPGKPGVLVLAGTGSNVAGRDAKGTLTSAGGWGPALADQGSGHKIGHEALRAVFTSIDQGITTSLQPAILEAWQLSGIEQIVEMANRIPAPDFSRLTEIVLRCALEGDEVAARVLQREGEDLAALVCIVMHRLQRAEGDPLWVPDIAFAGSIMERVLPVRKALIETVRRQFPGVHALDGVVDPVLGALWRARNGN
jgi:N-acetylglucosamine kinase-like BadF-type ATPase